MFKRLTVALLALTLAACSPATPTSTPSPDPTAPPLSLADEEEAVYAAVLAWNYPGEMYVLMATTDISASAGPEAFSELDCARDCLPGIADETIEDLLARNESVSPMPRTMDLGAPYVLMSMNDRRALFDVNQNGWEMFYSRYPNARGIATFSHTGFNADRDQALVYASMESSTSSAEGCFFFLTKIGDTWTVAARLILWSY